MRARYQQPKLQVRRNKSGSVYWAEWWEYQREPDGTERRVHRSEVLGAVEEMGKTEARKKLAGLASQPSRTSITTWSVERYIREVWLPAKRARWETNSRITLESYLKHILLPFGHMQLSDVRPYHLEAWLAAQKAAGISRSVGKTLIFLMRNIFRHALRNDFVAKNPAEFVELPRLAPPARTMPYSLDEVRAMTSLPGLDGLMMRTLVLTGVRPGEALALRAGDLGDLLTVDESTDTLGHYKCTKTRTIRRIPIPPGLRLELEALAKGMPADGLLFADYPCQVVKSMGRRIKALLGNAVRDFRLRRCRATCANLLEARDEDKQGILGHTAIEMTRDHYLVGDAGRQAAAVAELERRISGKDETRRVM